VKLGFGGLICCPSCRAPWMLDFRASTGRRGSSRRCDGHGSEHRLASPSSRPDGSMQNRSPHATLEAVNETAIARDRRGESRESRGRGMIQVNVMRAVATRSAVARWTAWRELTASARVDRAEHREIRALLLRYTFRRLIARQRGKRLVLSGSRRDAVRIGDPQRARMARFPDLERRTGCRGRVRLDLRAIG
jgi:hypothetical protein